MEEPKDPTTTEEEDVEAHGALDQPYEREGTLDEPEVEGHGLLDQPYEREGTLDEPDVEGHGLFDRPGLLDRPTED